jgi:hypothetical protein
MRSAELSGSSDTARLGLHTASGAAQPRNQVVTPDEPDEETEYYRRKSWLE